MHKFSRMEKKARAEQKATYIFLRFVEEGGFAVTVIFILCTEMLKCEIFDRNTYSAYELVIRSVHAYQTFQNGIVAMKRN